MFVGKLACATTTWIRGAEAVGVGVSPGLDVVAPGPTGPGEISASAGIGPSAIRTTSPASRTGRLRTGSRPRAEHPPQEVLRGGDQLVAVDPALVQHGVLDGAVDRVVQEASGHERVGDVER